MSEKKARKKPTPRAFKPVVIGLYLLELRKQKGLTQDEVADELGISKAQISRFEIGGTLLPDHALEAYAKAWFLEEKILKSIRDNPPKITSVLVQNLSELREAVAKYRAMMKAHHNSGTVFTPPATVRVGKRAEPVAVQGQLPLEFPDAVADDTAEDSVPRKAKEIDPNFLPWLMGMADKLPVPRAKEDRDAWLLAMSASYRFA